MLIGDLYEHISKYMTNEQFYKLQFIHQVKSIKEINRRKELYCVKDGLAIQRMYYNLFSTKYEKRYHNILIVGDTYKLNINYNIAYNIMNKFKHSLTDNYDKFYYFTNIPDKVDRNNNPEGQNTIYNFLSLYRKSNDRKMMVFNYNDSFDDMYLKDNTIYKQTNIILINKNDLSYFFEHNLPDFLIFPASNFKNYMSLYKTLFGKNMFENVESICNFIPYIKKNAELCIDFRNDAYYFI